MMESKGYVILCVRVPTTSAKGREGTEGISILGFRVSTTCWGKGREGSRGVKGAKRQRGSERDKGGAKEANRE